MAAKPKYVELLVDKTGGVILPTHPLAGYVVVSDYTGDQGRHLFLRRGALETSPAENLQAQLKAAPKKKVVKKSKAVPAPAPVTIQSEPVTEA